MLYQASPLPPSSPVPPPAEEDLVDALFRTCDTSGRGRVPAARIADHLTVILTDLQPRWLVESLKDTLCIDGEDNQLDITTYRELLTTWLHDHAKDVNILNSNNPDLDADATCSEVTDILSSPKPDLLAHESHTPVVTPARPSIRPADLTPVQATPCHLSATHLFAPTPVNRTQDSFAWCGTLRDLGDGGDMGRTPPRRQLLYEDRLRQCLEGQLSGGNRRSTLLPWLRPPGSSGPVPGDTLVMSRPPSPISPAASFIYNHTNNNNNNNVGGVSFRATVEKVGHAPPLADHSGLNYTFGSLEDEAGTHRPDPGELQQEVLELEHTNRRLTGENAELTTHLTHAEDLNTSLREQCRQLEQALTSVQHQLAGARRLEAEIEELRSLLDTERDEKGRLISRLAHLEKDNQELAARLEHLVDQVNVAHEEAEGWASREARLVAEHKTQVASLMNQLSHWKTQARTQGDLVHDLEDTVKELKKLTEVLKEEKLSLEHQLSHLREELASVNSQADHDLSGDVDEDVKDSRNGDNIVGSIKKVPWGLFSSTPFSGRVVTKSSQETPQSIHSEIQTMGENNGSLPFCEKSEDALLSISQAHGNKNRGALTSDSSTTLLSNMLKWWRQWEEHGMTLLLGVQGRDASALHDHFTAHHDELLKIENELQCIIKRKTSTHTPSSSGRPSLSEAVGGSETSSRSFSSPRSSISRPRTPGSHVSQLISKFENSSPSLSPAPSEISERLGKLVDYNSNVSKELDRSGHTSPSSSVGSPSRTSPVIFKNIRKLDIQRKQRSFEAEMCVEQINVSEDVSEEETDDISKDAHSERNVLLTENLENCDYLHRSETQGNKLADVSTEKTEGMLLKMGLDDSEEEKYQTHNNERDNLIEQFEGTESLTVEVELESDIYMENSHLMRLMRQVKEQKICIDDLKNQLCIAEEEKESLSAYLSRLHRLVLGVTSDTFRWTEGVRKEWLSRVPGVSEEGAADPLRSPDPLDDGALTGTHSREEIESLIRARCDLGCQHSKDELSKDYVNPENLAAELERELLALKLHVARSHALLHHYQSSSLYGSRSEVSTPPAPPSRQTQGVEAGVECDLCGPTCVPRPSGSTATQTPASPTPASISPSTPAPPECEESEPTSTLWEADEDAADADHVPLTPQHRPLYQKIVVPEEEEEEEAAAVAGVSEDDMAVSSDHALYIPKPRSSKRSGEEKLRRSGLATISPQKGGSSDSDDDTEAHPLRSPQTRLRQISPRSHSDPEVTPLSPPPSLYTEEEEEDEPCPKKDHQAEEEPALPSTPESGSSGASPEAFPDEKANTENKTDVSEGKSSPEDDATAASTRQEDEADTPQEEDQSGSPVFPSLPDHYLRALGLARDDQTPTENLSAQEIEGKFTQVSLALKTDRLTLRQRLDVQQRQRDTAETNFDTEINLLRSAVLALHADCLDTELVDTVAKVRRQLDVLTTTSTRLVTASEVWGAVQQEWRVSRALEVLLLHVENVKRLYERDHQELEEMRKVLAEYQIELPNSSGNAANASSHNSGDNPASSFRMRALSLAVSNKQQPQETRRISLATGTTRLTAFMGTRSSKRRASLMPDLRPFQESKASFAAAAAAVAAAASSRASISAASGRASISAASKDKTEENGQTANEVYSITEEGSESGGEGTETPPLGSSAGTATQLAISRTLAQLHPDLYSNDPSLTENRLSEDEPRTAAADSTVPATPSPSPELRPQHWLMVCLEDVMGWVRGGRWPYSSQQTVLGARYAFTSLLLLIAAFFLLLTISSSDQQVPQPYHPGWTSVTHVLHPFVTLRYVGNPPT